MSATMSALKTLRGAQARIAATVQGHIWSGISGARTIADHTETAEIIDRRGDAEMLTHLDNLKRIARAALERGEYETHAALQEEIARVELLIEWDCHEDYHRRATHQQTVVIDGSLHRANGGVGVLLGQAEAVCALDDTVHPLALCSAGNEP